MTHPLTQESPKFEPFPAEWDHLPTTADLLSYGKALIPGVDYCWVALSRQLEAAASKDGWCAVEGMRPFKVEGHPVILMGAGEPIPGAVLEDSVPMLYIDPELERELSPKALGQEVVPEDPLAAAATAAPAPKSVKPPKVDPQLEKGTEALRKAP